MQILGTHRGNTEKQKEAFGKLVEKEYGEEGSEKLEAYEKACKDLIEIFDEAESDLDAWLDERRMIEREERQRKHDETVAKRKEKLEPIIAALEAAVADAPHKELALAYQWNDSTWDTVSFKYLFVGETLGNLITAPSSASRKKLTAACADIRRKLVILSESEDFISLSFLSSSIAQPGSPRIKRVKQKMLEHCQRTAYFSSLKSLVGAEWYWSYWPKAVKKERNNINDRFFDLLEKKQYYDALLHVLEARNALDDIMQRVLVAESSSILRHHRSLAGECWKKIADERTRNEDGSMPNWTFASFNETLASCRLELSIMKANARDYLQHAPVREWLSNQGEQPHWSSFTRQGAINCVWYPRNAIIRLRWQQFVVPENIRDIKPYQLLLHRDFDRLLSIHQFYHTHRTSDVHHPPPPNNNNN